jgi:hypothetical protein
MLTYFHISTENLIIIGICNTTIDVKFIHLYAHHLLNKCWEFVVNARSNVLPRFNLWRYLSIHLCIDVGFTSPYISLLHITRLSYIFEGDFNLWLDELDVIWSDKIYQLFWFLHKLNQRYRWNWYIVESDERSK